MGTYLFRWPYPADHVYVTGTFDDWGKSEKLEKVGDHWEKEVRLPSADHKVMYKFVVNDEWIVDENAPKEDDGHYNVNNVLEPSQIKRLGHRVIATSRGRPGSLSADSPTKAATVSAGGEGAPLLTLQQSEANMNRWIPHVTADPRRPVTRRLTNSERESVGGMAEAPTVSAGGMGAPLMSKEESEANLARKIPHVTPDPDRPVTRSVAQLLPQTDGAAASKNEVVEKENNVPGAFPQTPANEPDTFNVDPLPATGHDNIQSSVTTSKEDYERLGALGTAGVAGAGIIGAGVAGAAHHADKQADDVSVQPLPATGHNNIQSSVTTSKDDYENLGALGTATTDPAPGGVSISPLPATGHDDLQSSVTTSKDDYENLGGLGTATTTKADPTPGEVSVAPLPATGHDNIRSSVTTSKDDYENLGGLGTAVATPPTAGEVSVAPLPATGHKDIQSSVTTSKDDYENAGGEGTASGEYGDQPIPATGFKDTQSSVTTSKEDYEKLGALGVVGATVAGAGALAASAFSKPKEGEKNIIPESSLPMFPEKTDTLDAGPFISSSGPGTTTADLASKVPLEPRREAQVVGGPEAPEPIREANATPFINSSGPGTTSADLASKVPLEPRKEAEVVDPSTSATAADPFVSSVGPGATTAGLASQVPLEPKRDAIVDHQKAPEPTSGSVGAAPFIASVGAGATTAALASQVPLEHKRDAQVVESSAPEAPSTTKEAAAAPFISSVGPDSTTEQLASQVPLEPKRDAEVVDPSTSQASSASPFISSVGAGATTAALASQVPLEKDLSPEVKEEKSVMEKELLSKVPESEAQGEPASVAKAQTSYYGLATAVPEPVEESMQKAHASPEAAAESSVVAEKSLMEQELQSKVPVVDTAGEPAPTISAATSSTAPATAATAASATTATDTVKASPVAANVAAADLTDGKTANETVPGTDTSTATTGHSNGELAAGTVAGTAAAAGAAALASRHEDKEAEPPRVSDAQKPSITTGVAPSTEMTSPKSAGSMGQASPQPGVAPAAAAAVSDGTEDPTVADEPTAPKITAPVEPSEATATEYAPPRAQGIVPGASPVAAAALSDGTEDPTLADEPAVKMMTQNEAQDTATTADKGKDVETAAVAEPKEPADSSDVGLKDTSNIGHKDTSEVGPKDASDVGPKDTSDVGPKDTSGVGSKDTSKTATTSTAGTAGTAAATAASIPETPKKKTVESGVGSASAASTPAHSTTTSTTSTPTGEQKRKKRHRLSAMIKKIFD